MWISPLITLVCLLQQVLAYRPVQHCKILGENGHYSACTALTQHYNTTTEQSDLFVRYNWFRYRSSKYGWHAIALGQQMAGALMFIMYGDPASPSTPMTVDIRTSDGHHPPVLVTEIERFKDQTPEIEIVTAKFDEYKGDIKIESLDEQPTHVGVAEIIVRGYTVWNGNPMVPVSNTTRGLEMIWSSNYQQDMAGDFSHGRNIDMHKFGLGFGWIFADILNAQTPEPLFGPIDELAGVKGVGETVIPPEPTADELAEGAAYISKMSSSDQNTEPAQSTESAQTTETPAEDKPVERPERTLFGKSVRDWMWHLHGFLMTIAFLALYPLGTYLIRSPSPTAFNSHWTIQSLATVAMVIGCLIGYVESYSISIKHQYIGIFLFLVIAAQIVLGWRHHVQYVATQRKTWLSKSHIYLGRIILPVGFVNIVLGMMRREYGWFTILLVVILMGLEAAFLIFWLFRASKNRAATGEQRTATSGPPRGDDAEEYFQLAGEDEFSDSDAEENEVRADKEQERKEQAERLRRLDKV